MKGLIISAEVIEDDCVELVVQVPLPSTVVRLDHKTISWKERAEWYDSPKYKDEVGKKIEEVKKIVSSIKLGEVEITYSVKK
jgi:hypothetical protein